MPVLLTAVAIAFLAAFLLVPLAAVFTQAFADGIRYALSRPFDRDAIRRHAERFGRARFGDEIQTIVDETVRTEGSQAC